MMAVQNKLVKPAEQAQERGLAEYEVGGQVVKISPNLVRSYLVNGNGQVSDQEVMMFISLCKYQKLNPFLREAYLIKYGNQPATMVTGKDAFMKRAMRNPAYSGLEAGVVVMLPDGLLDNRVGSIVLEGEQLVGGWAKVYVKGWDVPLVVTVSFDEYCLKNKDGQPMSNWAAKPATMIRKVAVVQALREAFPEDLGGMYAPEERAVGDLPDDIITTPETVEAEAELGEHASPVEEPKPVTKPAISTEVSQKDDAKTALFGK